MDKLFAVDLETMGREADAHILAIGVATRAREGGIDTFYRVLGNAPQEGRVQDPDTVAWWNKPENAKARKAWEDPKARVVTLEQALKDLSLWVEEHARPAETHAEEDEEAVFFGNGSDFDLSILSHAYARSGVAAEKPWAFWNVHCLRGLRRTEKRLAAKFRFEKAERPDPSVAHRADADAVAQLKWLEGIENNLARIIRR
jgi:hypothetical protein